MRWPWLLASALVLLPPEPARCQILEIAKTSLGVMCKAQKGFMKAHMGMRAGKMAKKEYDASFSKPKPFVAYKVRLIKEGKVCGNLSRELPEQLSPETCGHEVIAQEGVYFIFGMKGKEADKCYIQFTHADDCPEYGFQDEPHYNFYAMDQLRVISQLVGLRKTCMAKGKPIGNFPNVQKCAEAVQERGGKYYTFGTHAPKTGSCTIKYPRSRDCPEGLSNDLTDYYAFRIVRSRFAKQLEAAEATIISEDTTCGSKDSYVGWFLSVKRCATAVREAGGKYFLYGKRYKKWLCYMELTEDESCTEGLNRDKNYDFYRVVERVEDEENLQEPEGFSWNSRLIHT